jgi:hypothetical protein
LQDIASARLVGVSIVALDEIRNSRRAHARAIAKLVEVASIPQARRRLRGVPALLAEQKSRY